MGFVFSPSQLWYPSQSSNLAEIWDADDLTALGNGTAVTSWLGRIHGTPMVPLGSDMGTVKLNAFNGDNALSTTGLYQNNKAGDIQDSLINAIFTGTNKKFTVVTLATLANAVSNNYWSCGNLVATNQYQVCRYLAGTTVANQLAQQYSAVAQTLNTATEYQCNAPQLIEWTCGVGGVDGAWQFIKDGIPEAIFTRTNGGLTIGRVLLGGSATGNLPTALSNQVVNAFLIYDGLPSASDAVQLRLWAANRLGIQYKKGLKGLWTGKTYIHFANGQSNQFQEGRGVAPYTALTAPRAYNHFFDGMLKPANDPCGSNTNNSYPSQIHSGLGSATPAFCNEFYRGGGYGPDDALVMTGNSTGSTLASGWAAAVGFAPPVPTSLLGVAFLRLMEVLRNVPNPEIIAHDIYQGESDTGSLAAGDAWPGFWTTVDDSVQAYIDTAPYGLTRYKAGLHTLVSILPATNATIATPANWANTIANQQSYCVGRGSTCISTQSPSGPYTAADNLHETTAAQAVIGTTKAQLVLYF